MSAVLTDTWVKAVKFTHSYARALRLTSVLHVRLKWGSLTITLQVWGLLYRCEAHSCVEGVRFTHTLCEASSYLSFHCEAHLKLCYGCKTHYITRVSSLTVMLQVWGSQFHYVCKSLSHLHYVRLTYNYGIGVGFTHFCITSMRLTVMLRVTSQSRYRCEVTQIYTKSVRLIHSYTTCVSWLWVLVSSHLSYNHEAHSQWVTSVRLTVTHRVWNSLPFTLRVWGSLILELPLWDSQLC